MDFAPDGRGIAVSAVALLKIAAIPLLLWAVSTLARRFGPMVAGVVNGLPLISGPISFVVALEQGADFALDAAWGAYPGMTCLVVFGLCYAHFGRRFDWSVAVVASFAVYAACACLAGVLSLPQPLWAPVALAALFIGIRCLPSPVADEAGLPPPRSKGPYLQMAGGAALMTFITLSAQFVGPTFSGMFMFFPVIGSLLGGYFLRARCVNAVIFLFKGTFWGALTGWSFMMTLACTLPRFSIAVSYLAAVAAALSMSAVLVMRTKKLNRREQK